MRIRIALFMGHDGRDARKGKKEQIQEDAQEQGVDVLQTIA